MIGTVVAGILASTAPISGAERVAILDTARQPVVRQLGKPVKFLVRTLNRDGDWAFLVATMQDAQGRPITYAGTPLASAEAEGMISRDYVALLQRSGGRWRVVDQAVGPTDVAWEGWAVRYGAPAGLFR
jgi:hypothetical protein